MKTLKKIRFIPLLLILLLVGVMAVPATALAAQAPVELGTASSFAVLAGTTVTNTGPTIISGSAGGNVGVSPGSAITGFPPGIINNGAQHANDAVAIQAQTDLVTAYNDAAGRTPFTDLTGQDLGGLTLTPGVYRFSSSAQLTGTLTLDAQGDSNAAFIFQIGSALTTASSSTVRLINGAVFCRVFWQIGSSATLGTNSNFVGHILALTSITANTGATVQGQLLARNGAVTLDSNIITNGFCTGTLHVIKHVINTHGRTAVASDFTVHVKTAGSDVAGSPANGAESPGTAYSLAPGAYTVSEDTMPGYTVSFSGDSDSAGNITLAAGDNKTVTITNNDIPSPPGTATLHVIKHVINTHGRTAVASDFTVHVKTSGSDVAGSPAKGAESPGTAYTLAPGVYAVSEDTMPGYTVSFSGDSDSSGNITLVAGDNKTVTITNSDIPSPPGTAILHVIKHVINTHGRTAVASDFTLHVKISGSDVAGSPAKGAESPGTTYTLAPGTYVVSEDAHKHYTISYSGDSDSKGKITLAAGDNKTVTITDKDTPINPITGDYTADDSWIGIPAAVLGGMLIIISIILYLHRPLRKVGRR